MRRPDRSAPHKATLVAANDNARQRPRTHAARVEEALLLIAGIVASGAFYLAIGYWVWTYFAS